MGRRGAMLRAHCPARRVRTGPESLAARSPPAVFYRFCGIRRLAMSRMFFPSWERGLERSTSTLIACFLAAAATSRVSESSVLFESAFLSTDLDPGAGRVTIADLNGDGNGDLAMPNGVSSCVTIMLGRGNGTFGSRSDFPTGIDPSYVAIADLDRDGRLDLVVSNTGASTVSILLGRGDATFGAKTDLPAGDSPWEVAVADLNGDAKPDLVPPIMARTRCRFCSGTVTALSERHERS